MHIIQKPLFCLCLSVWYHAQNLEDFADENVSCSILTQVIK